MPSDEDCGYYLFLNSTGTSRQLSMSHGCSGGHLWPGSRKGRSKLRTLRRLMLAALAIGVLGATALGNTVIAATPPLQHSTATVIPLPQPRLVRDELMNPELPAQERALLQKPTEVVTGSYETLGPNGDPIAHAYVEWIELGIPMWEWNVWQGFSDNGTDITSFPPPTYSVDIWFPDWVLDNEGYSYTGRTGVTQGTSDNSAVFQFYAFGIPSLTVDAYIDFTLYGNGHWINSAGANPS
jgi:hypothetical protein